MNFKNFKILYYDKWNLFKSLHYTSSIKKYLLAITLLYSVYTIFLSFLRIKCTWTVRRAFFQEIEIISFRSIYRDKSGIISTGSLPTKYVISLREPRKLFLFRGIYPPIISWRILNETRTVRFIKPFYRLVFLENFLYLSLFHFTHSFLHCSTCQPSHTLRKLPISPLLQRFYLYSLRSLFLAQVLLSRPHCRQEEFDIRGSRVYIRSIDREYPSFRPSSHSEERKFEGSYVIDVPDLLPPTISSHDARSCLAERLVDCGDYVSTCTSLTSRARFHA